MTAQKFNIKNFVSESGLNHRTFKKELDIMLSDPTVKYQFGKYKYRSFTRKQAQLCIENIPFLDHLKNKFYTDNPDLNPDNV